MTDVKTRKRHLLFTELEVWRQEHPHISSGWWFSWLARLCRGRWQPVREKGGGS